ncbi:Uncharacterised protein [uncultured archaeon]|nr:Uncharacterised protein [uncultured archaeon]
MSEVDAIKKIMALPQAEYEVARQKFQQARPLFCRVTDMFNGTCRFFAVVFSTVGIILAFMGKLEANYVALVGAIQALLVTHSIGQDYHERNENNAPPAA